MQKAEYKGFGKHLKDCLIEKSMTQRELAEAAGTHEHIISRYVCGNRYPSLKSAVKLAKALDIDVNVLAEWLESEND